MARMDKPKTSRTVTTKPSKNKGDQAEPASMSDHRIQLSPDKTKGRGIGSSFAFAVGGVLQQTPEIKGSQVDFLGEPKELITIEQMTRLVEGK